MSSSFSAAGAKDRAESLFYKALDLPPGDRAAFLNEVCAQDANLRAEVDGYLLHYEQAGPFLKEDASASAELEAQLARLKPEEVGNRIGPYKLLEQIGEGGFGRVWVAEQEHPIRRRVALKIIKLGMDTKDVVARFEQERQALAMMDHPNIAKVFEAGATPFGRPFFVMELVRGVKITDYCDQTKLPTEERLRLFIAVCQAVQHAHQKGIIHRDLKPSNILVTLHDGVPVPKVIDFGVAKATQQQRLTDLTVYTQFEQMIGTPLYMSPEQAEMSGLDVDTRSDIYSLGVLLYELLIGKTPFDPERLMKAGYDEMRRVIREEEPQKPSTLLSTMAAEARTNVARHRDSEGAKLISSIKGDLDWIVMKALEKDRNRRYETASGLARDIERHLGSEPVLARPPSNLYRFRRFAKRNKVAFAASAAVLAMLVVGLGVSTWMFFQEKQARERAVAAEQEQGRLRQLSVAAEKAQSEERKKAESAASKSGQVAQFLTNMLKGVGPSVALGRDTRLLREILDKTAERVSKDLKDQPEVEADLRSIIGDVYFELGSYEQARAMHTEALAIRKKKLGNEHPGVAASLDAVAVALHLQGKFAEAEAMHREALAMQRKLLGNEHPSVTTSLNNLAQTLSKHGRFAEAEAMQREALAMQRKLLGNEHPSVATSLDNLAIALSKQGKLAEAETMSREGLAMQRKVRGSEHPEVAASLGNLATLLHGQNKLPEAEAMQREALAMQRKLLGSEHPDIAVSLGNLANVLHHQGKLAEAETMSREVLVMHRKLLGSEHPNVAGSLYNLASVLTKQGKLAEAETMNREGLGMLRKLLGNDHPDVAASLNDVAVVLHHQHKLAEAEATFREALALQRKLFGSEHPNVAVSLGNLANTLSQQGKLDEAETTFREVLVMQRKLFGSEHPSVGGSLNNLANVLSRKGKLIEAETMSREALVIARKSAKSPKDLEDSLQALAESLFRQRKYAEAEPLHRELVGSRQARLPAEDGGLTASIASLARLLADWAWSESGWISKAPTGSRAERDRLPQAAGTESAVTGSKSEISERAYEAERLLRECLASQLRSAKPNEWRADENRSRLGSALLAVAVTDATLTSEARQAKFAEAEALMLEANKALQQGDKIESKYKRDALTRIIRLYQTWNKPKQVADWERKLADFDKAAAKSASGEKSDSPRI